MTHPDVSEPRAAAFSSGDPSDGVIECLADYLAPLFAAGPDDGPTARLMAIRTMISYRPEMRADFIAVAQSISFSMSALAALSRAATEEMPAALRLRYFSVANALSRSADQSERTIERRRRLIAQRLPDAEGAADGLPEAGYPHDMSIGSFDPEPDDPGILSLGKEELEAGEAAIEAAVAEAMLEYTSRCMPAAPSAVASTGRQQTATAPDAAEMPSTATPSGSGAGEEPVSGDASPRQRSAKGELAAIISASERLGAVRQRERDLERSFSAKHGAWQTQTHGERERLPYARETATMRPEVPI